MSWLRAHLNYPAAIAGLALFLALGGGAYAATLAKKNSVVSKSVKNGSLTGADIKDDSLTGADIDEASLSLPAGVKGDKGDPGEPGTPGGTGPVTEDVIRHSVPTGTILTLQSTIEGLQIHISCNPDMTTTFAGSAVGDHGTLVWSTGPSVNATSIAEFADANGVQISNLVNANTFASGTVTFRRSGGRTVFLDFELVERTDGFGTTDDCFFTGFYRTAG